MNTTKALSLDDSAWAKLSHAYGSAEDIPILLRALADFPASNSYQDEPWFTLWSSLCHQGDVYPASFAAVPHVISAAVSDPSRVTYNYFLLPACIEIARVKKTVPIPTHLQAAYFDSLQLLPSLVAKTAFREWDESFCSSALAAIAVAKGQPYAGEVILELEGQAIQEILSFLASR